MEEIRVRLGEQRDLGEKVMTDEHDDKMIQGYNIFQTNHACEGAKV